MKTRISGLKKYQGANPRGYFEGLPWEVKRAAQMWLWRFCSRWGRDLPWRGAAAKGSGRRQKLPPPQMSYHCTKSYKSALNRWARLRWEAYQVWQFDQPPMRGAFLPSCRCGRGWRSHSQGGWVPVSARPSVSSGRIWIRTKVS